jgi:hypothetical protein
LRALPRTPFPFGNDLLHDSSRHHWPGIPATVPTRRRAMALKQKSGAPKQHNIHSDDGRFFVMWSVSFFLMCSMARPTSPRGRKFFGKCGFKIITASRREPVQD